MKVAYDHMHQLDQHIEAIELEMTKRCLIYSDLITHIIDLPGISAMSAMMIIAEIGVDMTQFSSDKQLCSWDGLAPANNESANKKKSTKISKAGDYLKPLLVQCALSAIKSNKEPYFKIKYLKIKKSLNSFCNFCFLNKIEISLTNQCYDNFVSCKESEKLL